MSSFASLPPPWFPAAPLHLRLTETLRLPVTKGARCIANPGLDPLKFTLPSPGAPLDFQVRKRETRPITTTSTWTTTKRGHHADFPSAVRASIPALASATTSHPPMPPRKTRGAWIASSNLGSFPVSISSVGDPPPALPFSHTPPPPLGYRIRP